MNHRPSNPHELASLLGPAEARLIALDFDGVLAPIVDHPGEAKASQETLDAVRTLAECTAVAVVSGRELADLSQRLGRLPLTLAGGHGAQLRYRDGQEGYLVDLAAVTPTLDEVEANVAELVDDEPGWLVERKEASLAVHHRLADPATLEQLLPRVTANLDLRRDDGPGFELISGKAVVELRARGVNKGGALAHIAESFPGLTPLAVGDDTTDEDAFRVARELGGTAILVAETPRETFAEHRLEDPAAVTTFLTALACEDR